MPESDYQMITTLTGPNSFLIKQNLNDKVTTFVEKYGELNVERVDGEDDDFNRINETLTGISLFASNKLVVLTKPSTQKQFIENFDSILKNIPESTEVIIIEPKIDKRLSYYKNLKSKTEFVECNELDTNQLAKWLSEQANDYGSDISTSDARYLIERVGQDQMNLSSEVQKLAIHSPKRITREDIDELTVRSPQSTIFDLIEAAMKGRIGRALELYEEQRKQLVEPQQIIAMLAWQLHILAIILSAKGKSIQEISSEAKINPFVARKTQELAGSVDMQQTKILIKDLLDIDSAMKSTSIDADEALKAYIVGLGQIN